MMVGTLAIRHRPLSGFFSKDEIFPGVRPQQGDLVIAVILRDDGVLQHRLMSMTFFGGYRGRRGNRVARGCRTGPPHRVAHPADPHAHGQAHKDDHEVSHGPAEPHDDAGSGHGHGPWPAQSLGR
jgi:hypothetical protein